MGRRSLRMLLVALAAASLLPDTGAGAGPPALAADENPSREVAAAPSPASLSPGGSPSLDSVALTFDADMTPFMLRELRAHLVASWYDDGVVQVLETQHTAATFFLTGLWTETYPGVARGLAQNSLFEIGNHTYDHAAFRMPCYGLGAASDRRSEILHAQQVIAATTGVTPALLRFPGNCYDAADLDLAAGLGLTVVPGNLPGWDGFNNDPAAVAAHVLSLVRPGSIVILHLQGGYTAPATAQALGPIIAGIRARGLRLVKVSQMFQFQRAYGRPRLIDVA